MSYSITPILHSYADKEGLCKIQIRIIYRRMKIYQVTPLKVRCDQFRAGQVVNHPNQAKMNTVLRSQIAAVEDIVLEAVRTGAVPLRLKEMLSQQDSKELFFDYIHALAQRMSGRHSAGYIRHVQSLATKVERFSPGARLVDIDEKWLERLEAWLRSQNLLDTTLTTNMKRVKSFLLSASRDGLIRKDSFDNYTPPTYQQKLVDFLEEREIEKFARVVRALQNPSKKNAGFYFLLSCYTGWRISDCKAFDYARDVHGTRITLRAKKNGQIVSMPIHSRLKEVLKYTKKNRFTVSEQDAREYVRSIALDAGITKRVKFHTGRHTFAMLLMANGFTIDEVAELIGDSPLITKVYARVHNVSLDKKIREKLG